MKHPCSTLNTQACLPKGSTARRQVNDYLDVPPATLKHGVTIEKTRLPAGQAINISR